MENVACVVLKCRRLVVYVYNRVIIIIIIIIVIISDGLVNFASWADLLD